MVNQEKLAEAWKAFNKAVEYEARIKAGDTIATLPKGLELMLKKACRLELEAFGFVEVKAA
jgi:hypothetical protein